ncbi:ribulose-phosphate 3-epimerase [Patescibacteria group bacterium]|nr:ribulose-phosphate 3-epimerase [Patescibacteria group bacterium]
MNMEVKIAPSILSADFGHLNDDISIIDDYVDYIHVDVMDGHFVPNLTFGAPVVSCIRSKHPLDVHLMIENPEKYLEDFAKAGANILTIHYEACENLSEVIRRIKEFGMKAGVSINPGTNVEVLEDILPEIDWALIMSVEPGFGGQSFMPNALHKIEWLRGKSPQLNIAVDGGINAETAVKVKEAGANVLIAGSYIFKAEDRIAAINSLR